MAPMFFFKFMKSLATATWSILLAPCEGSGELHVKSSAATCGFNPGTFTTSDHQVYMDGCYEWHS